MKRRTLFALVAALIFLALVAVLADRAEIQGRRSRLGGGPLLPDTAASRITRFDVTRAGTTWVVQEVDGTWRARKSDDLRAGEAGYVADVDAVRATLDALHELDRTQLKSTNADNHESMGVADTAGESTHVAVFVGEASPRHRLIIGKSTADQTSFVRLSGEVNVYSSNDAIEPLFERGVTGWRDRTIVDVAPETVVGLSLTRRDSTTTLELRATDGEQKRWYLVQPNGEQQATDAATVEFVLRTLTSLDADDFPGSVDPKTSGLPLATDKARAILADGGEVEVVFGHQKDDRVYVARSGVDAIFSVLAYKKRSILKSPQELVAKPADEDDVTPGSE